VTAVAHPDLGLDEERYQGIVGLMRSALTG
jgi:hypothetical protein